MEDEMILKKISKKAQEEMIGFGLIIIIVAVILLVFFSFSVGRRDSEVVGESHEVDSFIQSSLQYTTDCKDNLEFFSVRKLVTKCSGLDAGESCLDGRNICDVLESTLGEITEESWLVSDEGKSFVKGYNLEISQGGLSSETSREILTLQEGNVTRNFQGSIQALPNEIVVEFRAYY
jgi:hypothetical protein